MDVVYDIKQNFNEAQSKLMDMISYVSLLGRVVYTIIRTPQTFLCIFLFEKKNYLAFNEIFVLNIEQTKDIHLKSR